MVKTGAYLQEFMVCKQVPVLFLLPASEEGTVRPRLLRSCWELLKSSVSWRAVWAQGSGSCSSIFSAIWGHEPFPPSTRWSCTPVHTLRARHRLVSVARGDCRFGPDTKGRNSPPLSGRSLREERNSERVAETSASALTGASWRGSQEATGLVLVVSAFAQNCK